jgi:two-component system, LytTR family, sensor kinase
MISSEEVQEVKEVKELRRPQDPGSKNEPGAPGTKSSAKWWWAAVVCGGLGVFEATQTMLTMRAAGMHHAWTALFFTTLLSWVPWAVATPLVLRVAWKYPLFHGSSVGAWLRHGGTWLTLAVTTALWNAAMEAWLNPYVPDMTSPGLLILWKSKFWNQLVSTVVLYGVILLVGWMLESRAKLARQQVEASRLNEQLARAQLSALRQQIEPHFLFNTLNTIAGLVREQQNDSAVDMIAGLSELLRRTLQTTERQQVELGKELEIAEKYLEIERARFAERLRVRVDVPEELARVPSLILQPIVENAVKHGIAKRVEGGAIEISAARVNGTLTLSVLNDGPGFPQGWERARTGIGLENVRERLRSLYGGDGELEVGNEEGRGARVVVRMPFREEGKEVKEVKEVKE